MGSRKLKLQLIGSLGWNQEFLKAAMNANGGISGAKKGVDWQYGSITGAKQQLRKQIGIPRQTGAEQ